MRWFVKDRKGYPRYSNSGEPIHTAVVENKIGRRLKPWEVSHHNDGDKSNFRRENISVMSRSFHGKLHQAKKRGFWD